MDLIALLGDVGEVEAHFSLFGDSINLDPSLVHSLHRTRNRLGSRFGCTRWNSKATWVKWKLILLRLEIVLILLQDRCTVCADCPMGMEIILAVLDGTPGDVRQGEARFCPFGDSVRLDAR